MPLSLAFISRHEPTLAQQTLVEYLGYSRIQRYEIVFGSDPVSDLDLIGLFPPAEIAVVAPGHVLVSLLRAGFTVIEFANSSEARARHEFRCRDAYRISLFHTERVSLSDCCNEGAKKQAGLFS